VQPGPVLAVEERNGRIQAVHTGHAVVVGERGAVLRAWGEAQTETYARSAAKLLQALPFAAVADRLGLGDAEVAVACGSHSAEPFHVEAAQRILDAAGLSVSDLRCGVHDPGPQAGPMPASGWTAMHNNCSGKHAAMLAVCKERGWPLGTYLEPTHPLQAEVRAAVAKAAGLPDVAFGVDGCGLPTFWMPLSGLARSFQWLHASGDPRATRVLDAIARHPEMVGGTANSDTDTPGATKGRIVSKYGAVGVVAAVDRSSGQALALKMAAGASQPARAVGIGVMREAGWLRPGEAERLEMHLRPPMRNHMGALVGHLETR
jgi:L-asparaginase II